MEPLEVEAQRGRGEHALVPLGEEEDQTLHVDGGVHHYVEVGAHHRHHSVLDVLGEDWVLELVSLQHLEDDDSPLDGCAHCARREGQLVLGDEAGALLIGSHVHHQC